jgi:hypothetical protein
VRANTYSLEVKRTFQGEDEAQFLLRFMNGDRRVHRDTLQEIVLALQGLQSVMPITRQRVLIGDPTLEQQQTESKL